MWTVENRARYDRSKLRYPSDLTDDEWALAKAEVPAPSEAKQAHGGCARGDERPDVCAEHGLPVARDPEGPAATQHGEPLLLPLAARRHARPAAPRALRALPRAGGPRGQSDSGDHR